MYARKAFRSEGVITPGSFYSVSDAVTIETIEAGLYAHLHGGAFLDRTSGAETWSAFFRLRARDPLDVNSAEALWGKAEKAAVHYGAELAVASGACETEEERAFIRIGDAYRDALVTKDTSQYSRRPARW
jgi:hypothetical protein